MWLKSGRAPWPLLGCALLLTSCAGSSGACVGESSPGNGRCKDGWEREECEAWDEDEVNGSDWTFHAGEDCQDLGYTERCVDGSYADESC